MNRKKYQRWLAVLVLIVVADRVLKVIAKEVLEQPIALIGDWFHFGWYANEGVGFGVSLSLPLIVGLTTLILIALLAWLVFYFHQLEVYQCWAIGLWLAGGLANWYDRVRYGYVIDYLEWFDIGIANIADGAIIVGVVIWLVHVRRRNIIPSATQPVARPYSTEREGEAGAEGDREHL